MKTMMMIRFKTLHRCVGLATMLAFLCGCSPTDVVRVGQIAVTGDIDTFETEDEKCLSKFLLEKLMRFMLPTVRMAGVFISVAVWVVRLLT